MTDPSTAAQRWSRLHHGIDPARVPLVAPWLRLMWWLATPLVRLRVPPTAVTAAGAVLAIDAALLAGGHQWAAGVAVLVAAVCDGLDGAVAVVGDRATRYGATADTVADRVAEMAFAIVLWRCGAPGWLAIAAGASALSVDGMRRVRAIPSRITVAERPTTTICTVLACGSAAVSDANWPATVCATVWVVAAVTGLVQLSRS